MLNLWLPPIKHIAIILAQPMVTPLEYVQTIMAQFMVINCFLVFVQNTNEEINKQEQIRVWQESQMRAQMKLERQARVTHQRTRVHTEIPSSFSQISRHRRRTSFGSNLNFLYSTKIQGLEVYE